jgi:hypothetical protein
MGTKALRDNKNGSLVRMVEFISILVLLETESRYAEEVISFCLPLSRKAKGIPGKWIGAGQAPHLSIFPDISSN